MRECTAASPSRAALSSSARSFSVPPPFVSRSSEIKRLLYTQRPPLRRIRARPLALSLALHSHAQPCMRQTRTHIRGLFCVGPAPLCLLVFKKAGASRRESLSVDTCGLEAEQEGRGGRRREAPCLSLNHLLRGLPASFHGYMEMRGKCSLALFSDCTFNIFLSSPFL